MERRSSEGGGCGPGPHKDAVVARGVEARIGQEIEADATMTKDFDDKRFIKDMTKPKILAEKLLREPLSFESPLILFSNWP